MRPQRPCPVPNVRMLLPQISPSRKMMLRLKSVKKHWLEGMLAVLASRASPGAVGSF